MKPDQPSEAFTETGLSPAPTIAIAALVTSAPGAGLAIRLSRIQQFALSAEQPLDAVVRQVAAPGWNGAGDPVYRKPGANPRASALSLFIDQPAYYLLKLHNSLGAQFSTDVAPFRRAANATGARLARACCVNDGVIGVPNQPAREEGCTLALFEAARTGEGNFVAAFDIYLEALGQIGGLQTVTPIILDPDVRWPDGTGNP